MMYDRVYQNHWALEAHLQDRELEEEPEAPERASSCLFSQAQLSSEILLSR